MHPISGAPPANRRPLFAGAALGVLLACLAALVVIFPAALLRWDSSAIETWYGNTILNLVASVSSRGLPDQRSQTVESVAQGRLVYTASCAQCHGAAGDGKSMFGASTFPYATDIASQDAKAKADAQLFWIIKNGLGFTAMPGFANAYHDEDLWAVVSYVRSLQRDGS